MAPPWCPGALCLQALLWVVVWSGASQEQPCPAPDTNATAADVDELLWAVVHQVVQLDVEPLVTKLDHQQSRLDAVVARQDSQQSQLDEVGTCRCAPLPRDCSDLPAGAQSGVYLLQLGLGRLDPPVPSYCDLNTAGGNWTVFQRRVDIRPRQDFFLGWTAYSDGFGELDMEFWWGLDHLWTMTSPRDRRYELRIDLEDFEGGKRHAAYQGFRISSKTDGYRLTAVNYTGNAGDSLSRHVGKRFSTKDKYQGPTDRNCAKERKGAWWYDVCHDSNLNGQYLSGITADDVYGITWKTWRGYNYSLKTVEMKIRPTMKSLHLASGCFGLKP